MFFSILIYIVLSDMAFLSFGMLFHWIFILFWFSCFFLNLDLHPSEWLLCCSKFFSQINGRHPRKHWNTMCGEKKGSRENRVHSEISFKIDGGNSSKSPKWTPWGRYTKMKKKTQFKWNAKKRIKTWQFPNKTNKKLPQACHLDKFLPWNGCECNKSPWRWMVGRLCTFLF